MATNALSRPALESAALGSIPCRPASPPASSPEHGVWRPAQPSARLSAISGQLGYDLGPYIYRSPLPSAARWHFPLPAVHMKRRRRTIRPSSSISTRSVKVPSPAWKSRKARAFHHDDPTITWYRASGFFFPKKKSSTHVPNLRVPSGIRAAKSSVTTSALRATISIAIQVAAISTQNINTIDCCKPDQNLSNDQQLSFLGVPCPHMRALRPQEISFPEMFGERQDQRKNLAHAFYLSTSNPLSSRRAQFRGLHKRDPNPPCCETNGFEKAAAD